MGDLTEVLKELTPFLTNPNPQLRSLAVANMFSLTGSQEYFPFFRSHPDAVDSFVKVVQNDMVNPIRRDALSAIVNLAADQQIASSLAERNPLFAVDLVDEILNPTSEMADTAAAALANITRATEDACRVLIKGRPGEKDKDGKEEGDGALYRLLNAFCNEQYNQKNQGLHWLGAVFSNITQMAAGRDIVCNKQRFAFQRLLSFLQHPSAIRRGGVVGMVRNCCFDSSLHQWLMGPEVDVLPYLLLPLAGGEELSDEDMEGMPDELQYLPADKEREADPAVRKMLLEALIQLAARRAGRETLRAKKVYPIIRDLHRWEKNEALEKPIYDLVQILIGDEEGVDNLHEVELPPTNPKVVEVEEEEGPLIGSIYTDGLTINPLAALVMPSSEPQAP
eukprot:comp17381_c0_seq1/m.16693 comp17381_c0_seq1/g.16693  ORF comp17381_c0_seq1/g.16693 comp17381_c0_seq1/m.16693 type:complete len:393 (-) comp17381_c0_seq1:402-1580(-)